MDKYFITPSSYKMKLFSYEDRDEGRGIIPSAFLTFGKKYDGLSDHEKIRNGFYILILVPFTKKMRTLTNPMTFEDETVMAEKVISIMFRRIRNRGKLRMFRSKHYFTTEWPGLGKV